MVDPIGGQAVIEGVMMRSKRNVATAVRKDDGNIVAKRERLMRFKFKFFSWPFFRGVVNLIEMLVVGLQGLIWSANQLTEEDEEFSIGEILMLLITSIGFALLFFVALPYFLTSIIGFQEAENPILFNFIDVIIKIIIFVVYVFAISLMSDVKRLFEYHGAEHKVVHCFEAGKELTVKNCVKYSTLHPRCGTSFIALVFLISILVFSLVPVIVIGMFPGFETLNFWFGKIILFALRIMTIPIIAGIAYEVLRLSNKFEKNFVFKIFTYLGLLFQRLTTREPGAAQVEVAVKALNEVRSME